MDLDWIILNYDFYETDDFYVVNIEETTQKDKLESVKEFIKNSKMFYINNDAIINQAIVDIRRQACYINDKRVSDYKEFIEELKKVHKEDLINDLTLITTQASLFPITKKLFEKYQDLSKNIHITDVSLDRCKSVYGKDQLDKDILCFYFWVMDGKVKVEITKVFKVIQLDKQSEPKLLKKIHVNMYFYLDNNQRDLEDVNYTIKEY